MPLNRTIAARARPTQGRSFIACSTMVMKKNEKKGEEKLHKAKRVIQYNFFSVGHSLLVQTQFGPLIL
jgi:hypothetical protein